MAPHHLQLQRRNVSHEIWHHGLVTVIIVLVTVVLFGLIILVITRRNKKHDFQDGKAEAVAEKTSPSAPQGSNGRYIRLGDEEAGQRGVWNHRMEEAPHRRSLSLAEREEAILDEPRRGGISKERDYFADIYLKVQRGSWSHGMEQMPQRKSLSLAEREEAIKEEPRRGGISEERHCFADIYLKVQREKRQEAGRYVAISLNDSI